MKRAIPALLLCVLLLSLLTACDGFEGEALTGVVGESLIGAPGESLRAGSYESGGAVTGGSGGGDGALSGTYYASDGSGSVTFSGSDRISISASGFEELDTLLSAFGGSMTYKVSGNTLRLTIKVSFMGYEETETMDCSFERLDGRSFILEGVLFEKR
ncbi:MAG: hypothetical protein LBH95_04720 [Oscillospiraceae bacterium]|nr:hypothetical protein [Oscillospiraceae bacterium]